MSIEMFQVENGGEPSKDGINDLALGRQPQTISVRPGGALRVVVGRDTQGGGGIPRLPMAAPVAGVEATVGEIEARDSSTSRLKGADMTGGRDGTLGAAVGSTAADQRVYSTALLAASAR